MTSTRRTRMPAYAAATGFEPIISSSRPKVVNPTRYPAQIATTTNTMTDQGIEWYAPMPRLTKLLGNTYGMGVPTTTSATLDTTNIVTSVTISGCSLPYVMISPLRVPMAQATTSAMSTATQMLRPDAQSRAMTTPVRLATLPMDRSMPPVSITRPRPMLATAIPINCWSCVSAPAPPSQNPYSPCENATISTTRSTRSANSHPPKALTEAESGRNTSAFPKRLPNIPTTSRRLDCPLGGRRRPY